jgi:hypothetical protein
VTITWGDIKATAKPFLKRNWWKVALVPVGLLLALWTWSLFRKVTSTERSYGEALRKVRDVEANYQRSMSRVVSNSAQARAVIEEAHMERLQQVNQNAAVLKEQLDTDRKAFRAGVVSAWGDWQKGGG